MQNNDVRRTTKQLHLSDIVQTWYLPVLSQCETHETDAKKIITASPWRTGREHRDITWMKIIHSIRWDLKSNNLFLNEAIDMAQNRPLWRLMSTSGTMRSKWCMPEMDEWWQMETAVQHSLITWVAAQLRGNIGCCLICSPGNSITL